MDANTIITDTMTLEEKLEAIDKAMLEAQFKFNVANGRDVEAPVDPMDLPGMQCTSCQ